MFFKERVAEMDKEKFFCQIFDIIQEKVDFKVRFTKTYQSGKDSVPVLTREGKPGDYECFPSIYVGNAYTAYREGSTMQEISEKIIDKLRNSVRYIEPSLAGGIAGRSFCDIKDRVFIAETDVVVKQDLLRVWHIGDLYFTYLIDISRDRDFSVFIPVLKDTLKAADMINGDIFGTACYNMEMNTQVEVSVIGACNGAGSELKLPLYQALPVLSTLEENPTYVALLKFEPSFLSMSILVMDDLLWNIGQHVGRDYCIFQLAEGFCSIALVSRKVIEQKGELLAEMFKAVYKMYNREEIQPTEHIFYYSCNDERLYVK